MPWSAAAPLLCAVHCLLTPLLVAAIPALDLGWGAEFGMFLVSVTLVTWTLRRDIPSHGERRVLVPALLGLGLWGAALLVPTFTLGEFAVGLGAMATAGALLWNARLHHRAPHAGCAIHQHAERHPS